MQGAGSGVCRVTPHYVTTDDFLKKLDIRELERLRNRLVYDLLRIHRSEGDMFPEKVSGNRGRSEAVPLQGKALQPLPEKANKQGKA